MIDTNVLPHLPVIRAKAAEHTIDLALLTAIVTQESHGRHWCPRFEERFEPDPQSVLVWARRMGTEPITERMLQRTSWGLAQVMGAVARERGFMGHIPELCQPEVGLEFACLHLRHLAALHKVAPVDAVLVWDERLVASYNRGSPIRSKQDPTKWVNEKYVREVETKWREIAKALARVA